MAFYDQVTIRVANTEAQQVKIAPANIQEILIVGTNNAYRVKIVLASGRSYFLLDIANKSTFSSLEEASHVVDYFITLITDPEISRTVIDREIPEEPLPDHVPSMELFKAELDKKINATPGKGLSTNDFTNTHLVKVNKLKFDGDKYKFLAEDGEYRSIDASIDIRVVQEITEDALDTDVLAVKPLKEELDKKLNKIENVTQTLDGDFADDIVPSANVTKEELSKKVDKVDDKGLSTNDFTTTLKNKLDNIGEATNTIAGLVKISSNYITDTSSGTALSTAGARALFDIVSDLQSPIDYIGVIAGASLTAGTAEATIQSVITGYAAALAPSHVLTVGDALIITNTASSPYIYQWSGQNIDINTGGTWMWIYDGNSWAPAIQFPTVGAATTTIDGLMTAAMVTKLSGIESGAQVNVQSDWNQTDETADDFIKNKPKFATDRDITALINVGAIESQDLIPQGTTLTEFIEKLVLTTFYPTYTAPTFSLTFRVNNTTTTTYEVGTVANMTFTGALNRGSIRGAISNGIWVPTLSQNPRSGDIDYFTLAGENTGISDTHVILDHTVQLGTKSFQSSANYLQGPQPTDSKGNNYQKPLSAGRTNVVTSSIIGVRALFYGVNNPASNSSDIRILSNKALNPTNGTKFTINIPAGASNVIFAYPATLRNVTSVKYVEGLGAEVKDAFNMATFNVEGANGFTAVSYKVYKYTPVEPFGSTATYEVTI